MKMKALAGIMTLLFIASMLSTAYGQMTVDLLADQNLDVGDIIVEEVDIDGQHCLNITYVLAATLVDPDGVPDSGDEYTAQWYLLETHLAVVSSVGEFPMAKGGPKVGHFPIGEEFDPPAEDGTGGTTSVSYYVPYTADTTVFIGAQAEVAQFDWVTVTADPDGVPGSGDEYQYNAYLAILEETAWASGLDFAGSNWAMYFQYPAAA